MALPSHGTANGCVLFLKALRFRLVAARPEIGARPSSPRALSLAPHQTPTFHEFPQTGPSRPMGLVFKKQHQTNKFP
jgi:hypothetical protein